MAGTSKKPKIMTAHLREKMSKNQGRLNDQPPKPTAKPYTNPDHMNVNNNGFTSPARNKPTKPAR